MNNIIDKVALILLPLVALFSFEKLDHTVVLFLISIILSELIYLLPHKIDIIPVVIYCIFVLFIPSAVIMLPLFIYDILWLRKYTILILCAVIFAVSFSDCNDLQVVCILIDIFLAATLHYRTSNSERLKKNLKEQRDKSEEIRIALNQKNMSLIEKQNIEIYMATLKERNRIAREIHDNVGHLLTRSIVQTGALQVINKDTNLNDHIVNIKNTLNDAMYSIRSSVHNLHDTTINLENLIYECVKPLKESFTVSIDYDISDSTHINLKLCILGIIKEAVSNIIKHSNGDSVSISIHEHPAFYQIIVLDNGGCSDGIKSSGMGIASMKERAENSGGVFTLRATKNEFRIFVTIPKSS